VSDLEKKLIDKMANQASRRGFLYRVGAAALGLFAASKFGTGIALAYSAPLYCCSGQWCGGNSCPAGTSVGYTWTCCDNNLCGTKYRACADCCTNGDCTTYPATCTYTYIINQYCPC